MVIFLLPDVSGGSRDLDKKSEEWYNHKTRRRDFIHRVSHERGGHLYAKLVVGNSEKSDLDDIGYLRCQFLHFPLHSPSVRQ